MLSPADALRAHGAGTQEWLAVSKDMSIVAYVTPLASAGSAAVSAADLEMPPVAPARRRVGGAWQGKVWTSPDFDETDEDLIRLFEGEDDRAAPR